jgi:surface carbohydrate biosynthesis protein
MDRLVKYKILFPVETAARELLYKTVLSIKFAQLGYTCYLGSKDQINRLIWKVKPFAYFDKGYHANVSEPIFENIKENSGVIINLDEEGGVDFKNSSTISARYPAQLFRECDLIFLWGKQQYELIKENRIPFDDSKVVVSGHPRFQLLKAPFHFLYDREKKAILDRFPKYILVNTNMGFGNNINGDEFSRINYGSRIKNIEEIIAFDKLKIRLYINLIKQLSSLYEGTIIMRPHPEENKSTYISAFMNLKNVKVLFEGSVIPWILGAEVMIHPDCTTGIESMMLGKTPLSYLPAQRFENTCTFVPVKLSHECSKEEDVISWLFDQRNAASQDLLSPLLEDYFSFGKDSISIIVKSVHELLRERQSEAVKELSFFYQTQIQIKDLIRPFYHRILKHDIKLYQNKLAGLNPHAVFAIIDKAVTLFGLDHNVTVKSMSDSLYRIQ